MATAATALQQGQGSSGQPVQQQAGTPTAREPVQVQAETPPPRRITDFASI